MSSTRATGVVIVADVRLYREGLAAMLADHEGLVVLGTAASGDDAIPLVASTRPDVVAIDLASRDGLQIVRALRSAHPSARIVAFAIEDLDSHVLGCAEAGVAGYVPYDASTSDLVAVIEGVMRDEFACSPRTAAMLFRRLATVTHAAFKTPVGMLTRRELEIVSLIDTGLSNKEIARQLVIEVPTVKNHVHRILDKLQVTSRAEAAARIRGALPRRPHRPIDSII